MNSMAFNQLLIFAKLICQKEIFARNMEVIYARKHTVIERNYKPVDRELQ